MNTVTIVDRGGETSVMLDRSGDDHIAVRYLVDSAGYEREITLPANSEAWDRAVRRAKIGAVFL